MIALLAAALLTRAQQPTFEERAKLLVSQMTLEEKVRQMQNSAPAIPRLGIPAYDWWNEGLHGAARAGLASVFPQAIGLAATWDTNLEQRIADVISTEARAKYNDAVAQGNHGRYYGLTFWSPNINIFRDPRWGRGQETFGEDPYLTSEMALAFIHGMQGSDPAYFKTIATAKHFAVHSGPEVSRHRFDARPSTEDLDDTYLYAFRKVLQPGGAYSVMCAYNRLDGAPACASDFLLKDKLRGEWKFPGFVVSDCGAVSDIFRGHKVASSMAEAASLAVKAGDDLTCGSEYVHLTEAVQQGLISEKQIDESVVRLFVARLRLGMFDKQNPFSTLGMESVATAEGEKLALEAAEKSIVLLKNENHLLPLRTVPKKIAVLGPAADDPDLLLGNYYGTPRHLITPLAGIQQKLGAKSAVQWALGSVYANTSTALVPASALPAGVTAEYFNNEQFSGEPALKRIEPRGYFVWAMHDPAVLNALPNQNFSVRWRFSLQAPFSGDYDLGLARQECDSCLGTNSWRLSMNGTLLAEENAHRAAGGYRTVRKTVHLEAGQRYQFVAEYAQHEGGSGFELVWTPPADALLAESVTLAKQSDLAIVCIGLNSRLEGEESPIEIPGFAHGDRTTIDLPKPQDKLLRAVVDTGKPVVVVLTNGSALAVDTKASAILETWYAGQEGGRALANTLTGENNPAGRLPVTFYASTAQLPDFSDYSMKGRTYRFFAGTPQYAFGFGLSYSTFEYAKLAARRESNGQWRIRVQVKNTSAVEGDEVAQLYSTNGNGKPWLSGFERIHLKPGQRREVVWLRNAADLRGTTVFVAGGQPVSGQSLSAVLGK